MRFATYKGNRVKVLGTEEGMYVIEFENGVGLNCSKDELILEEDD